MDFRTIALPTLNCTTTTFDFTIDPLLPLATEYIVQVVDTSGFTVGETVQILGTNFTIASITNATTFRLTVDALPVAAVTFSENTLVCTADCCTILDAAITTLETKVDNYLDLNTADGGGNWLWAEVNQAAGGGIASTLLTTIAPTVQGPTVTLGVTNSSCQYAMGCTWDVEVIWEYQLEGAVGEAAEVTLILESSGVTGLVAAPTAITQSFPIADGMFNVPGSPGVNRKSFTTSITLSAVVLPLASHIVAARATAFLGGSSLATGVRVNILDVRITAVGVAIR